MFNQVFIVDDDFVTVKLHKITLAKTGLSDAPQAFYNGKEAFDFFMANHNPAHKYLVFLDINMPLMNGWELLDKMEHYRIDYNFSVVMASSSIDPDDKAKAMQYNCVVGFIEKPLNKLAIAEVLGSIAAAA
jgi:CheY-like chemotaxis protein